MGLLRKLKLMKEKAKEIEISDYAILHNTESA